MMHGGKKAARFFCGCAMVSLVLGCELRAIGADADANPYQGIVDRNVFGLKPPPPPVQTAPPKPPPVKITLTGITTILGNKRVLMKAPVTGAKPGAPTEQSYILAEGQRDGDIEVLQIDEKKGEVKINNAGEIVTLDWESNGIKGAGGGAPGPAPGGAPVPMNPFAPPGSSGMNPMPSRALRLPGSAANSGGGLGVVSSAPAETSVVSAGGVQQPGTSAPRIQASELAALWAARGAQTKKHVDEIPLPPPSDLPPVPQAQPGTGAGFPAPQ
jgi:hypothetical protein